MEQRQEQRSFSRGRLGASGLRFYEFSKIQEIAFRSYDYNIVVHKVNFIRKKIEIFIMDTFTIYFYNLNCR